MKKQMTVRNNEWRDLLILVIDDWRCMRRSRCMRPQCLVRAIEVIAGVEVPDL